MTDRNRFLTLILRLDAVATAAVGALTVVLAGHLDDLLGVPAGPAVAVGILLLAFAAVVAVVAGRPPGPAVTAVLAVNLLWVVASGITVALAWSALTTAGVVVLLGQAVAVAVLADLQLLGLRRVRPA